MICPTDDQPCTGDHSAECFTECSHRVIEAWARQDQRRSLADMADTTTEAPPLRRFRITVIADVPADWSDAMALEAVSPDNEQMHSRAWQIEPLTIDDRSMLELLGGPQA